MSQPLTTIHILDTHTANQIAAGEVVERPFSVIKELVENAIDAGATSITVRLHNAGCEKIRVTDNGCGMSPEDMRLAVQRHATSKISSVDDLDSLSTLGFRGEALPSIASVCQLTITSKCREQETGYTMRVEEGKATIPEECAANDGTVVEVNNLFYNTPARKKFLKTPRTELGLISDYLCRMAVCHLDIAFTLMNGNHRILVTTGKGNIQEALVAGFGHQVSRYLHYIQNEDASIRAVLSSPAFTRSIRNNTFFVNDRIVRSRELAEAVDQAYHGMIPAGRHPFTIIMMQVPMDSIDVNVHPSKLEIKLRDPQAVQEQLFEFIKKGFQESTWARPKLTITGQPVPISMTVERVEAKLKERAGLSGPALAAALRGNPDPIRVLPGPERAPEEVSAGNLFAPETQETKPVPSPAPEKQEPKREEAEEDRRERLRQRIAKMAAIEREKEKAQQTKDTALRFSALSPIGQFAGTFILAADAEALYIIDQHAAAERVQYEKILKAVGEQGNESMMLAVPIPLELSYREDTLLTDHILEIRDRGFILEHFGDNSYIIRGGPVWLGNVPPDLVLRDYRDFVKSPSWNVALQLRQRELYYMACHRALKGNQYLTNADITALFADLEQCKEPFTCPHGRPIALCLTLHDLYKHFLRGSI